MGRSDAEVTLSLVSSFSTLLTGVSLRPSLSTSLAAGVATAQARLNEESILEKL